MSKMAIGALMGATALVAAQSAAATVLKVTYTDSAYSASWMQDSNPTPTGYTVIEDTAVPIWGVSGDAFIFNGHPSYMIYFNSSFGGAFNHFFGPQLYTGSEATPVFSSGSFSGIVPSDGSSTGGVITFSAVTGVPEPATWLILLAGVAMLGAGFRNARKRDAVATG